MASSARSNDLSWSDLLDDSSLWSSSLNDNTLISLFGRIFNDSLDWVWLRHGCRDSLGGRRLNHSFGHGLLRHSVGWECLDRLVDNTVWTDALKVVSNKLSSDWESISDLNDIAVRFVSCMDSLNNLRMRMFRIDDLISFGL